MHMHVHVHVHMVNARACATEKKRRPYLLLATCYLLLTTFHFLTCAMEKKSRPGATCQAVVRGMHAWQGWLGKVWLGVSTRGNHQPALEAALRDVVGVAQRSAHLVRARFRVRA